MDKRRAAVGIQRPAALFVFKKTRREALKLGDALRAATPRALFRARTALLGTAGGENHAPVLCLVAWGNGVTERRLKASTIKRDAWFGPSGSREEIEAPGVEGFFVRSTHALCAVA